MWFLHVQNIAKLTTPPADVTTTSSNISDVGQMQRLNDDVTMTLILGVTLGAVLATATFIVVCAVWLVWWRRRRRQQAAQLTAANRVIRVDSETTENRRNESCSMPRNNDVTSSVSRYTKDGTLVLTVSNDCTGNGSDATLLCAGRASYTKNDKAAACTSPGKPSISTVSDDVTRFGRTTTDDVNVWPYDSADDCQVSAPCDVSCGGKYDEHFRRLRRGSSQSVCDDACRKYLSKYPHRVKLSTEDVDCQSPRYCRDIR